MKPEPKVDYSHFPILILNPQKKTLSWQKELEGEFTFLTASCSKECFNLLESGEKFPLLLCTEVISHPALGEHLSRLSPQPEVYMFLSLDQFQHLSPEDLENNLYHPLIEGSPTAVLRKAFISALEIFQLRKDKSLLMKIRNQENWPALLGQMTREWAHAIKNHIAIISLHAEITIAKSKKLAATPSPDNKAMVKIIEQCSKISGILDEVRGLSKAKQETGAGYPLSMIIEESIALLQLKNPQQDIIINEKLKIKPILFYSEGILLRSALINILEYCLQGKSQALSVLIEEGEQVIILEIQGEGIPLKISPPATFQHLDPSGSTPGSPNEFLKRSLWIGTRLIHSLGGGVSLKEQNSHTSPALCISFPYHESSS